MEAKASRGGRPPAGTTLVIFAIVASAAYLGACRKGELATCPAWLAPPPLPPALTRACIARAPPLIINVGRPFLPKDALRRGTSNYGGGERMLRLGQKLLAGQPITVAFLGGSITWGRGGGNGGSFVQRFSDWLNATWRHPGHRIINQGLPAVTSALFAACYDQVPEDSDLVVLEFAVNDGHVGGLWRDEQGYSFTGGQRRGFEQLMRKSLKLRGEPAVALLQFFSWNATRDKVDGIRRGDSFFWRTVEDELSVVAAYYDAPVLSLRNAVYHLMREQRHGFLWNVSIHRLFDARLPDAEQEPHKDAQFFWDESHPWDRTGHRSLAELLMAAVTRGVQAAMELELSHLVLVGRRPSGPLPLQPLPPLPPPMVTDNYEANATSCHLQERFEEVIGRREGFSWEARVPEETSFIAQKWGLTAKAVGASASLAVDTSLGGISGQVDRVQVHLLYLRSWGGMGKARLECAAGCSCEPVELDGHWERPATLTELHTLQVTPDTGCQLRLTVLNETSSGEHMFSVSGVVVSALEARMERGSIGQWEYERGKT